MTFDVNLSGSRNLCRDRWHDRRDGRVTASLFNLSPNFCPERIQFGQGSLSWIHRNTSWFHLVSFVLFVLLMYYCNSFSVRTWDGPPLASCLIFNQVFVSLDALIFWECNTSCIFKMHFPFSTTLAVLGVHHVPLKIRSTFVYSDTYRSCSMGFFYSSSIQVRHKYHMTWLKNRPEGGMSILAYLKS